MTEWITPQALDYHAAHAQHVGVVDGPAVAGGGLVLHGGRVHSTKLIGDDPDAHARPAEQHSARGVASALGEVNLFKEQDLLG